MHIYSASLIQIRDQWSGIAVELVSPRTSLAGSPSVGQSFSSWKPAYRPVSRGRAAVPERSTLVRSRCGRALVSRQSPPLLTADRHQLQLAQCLSCYNSICTHLSTEQLGGGRGGGDCSRVGGVAALASLFLPSASRRFSIRRPSLTEREMLGNKDVELLWPNVEL